MKSKRFHMSKLQKKMAILNMLAKSEYPLTAYQMGRALGFANGVPLENTLLELVEDDEIVFYCEDANDQAKDFYFWLPGQFLRAVRENNRIDIIEN